MKHQIHISGYDTCSAYIQAKKALIGLQAIFPDLFTINIDEHSSRDEYQTALPGIREMLHVENHKTSPIVWFANVSTPESMEPVVKFLGGRDDTIAWCKKYIYSLTLPSSDSTSSSANATTSSFASNDVWNADHGFMYDLVVIGGGSGGLACSKEAARLGMKVAVLDFVKPSPKGTKWGLGGTCVNVGCIPKKLMHTAALLGEAIHDAHAYGWEQDTASLPYHHTWTKLKDHVQDYIKGLNFGYRVQLREKNVTYLNKLASFQSDHELRCVDSKGKVEIITSARFVIAVGGRPSALDCPGSEFAISSDDLFSLSSSPGKACVIGGGYVALECAGFIAGLKQGQVTTMIRSVPLRGFDRDTVDRVMEAMHNVGVKVVEGVTPSAISKLPTGRLLVEYSNGEKDEYDTVLTAVGRYADTKSLGLENLSSSISINSSNGKLSCLYEQTSISHIYAVGDVVDSTPELTPAAILAGKLLARRLYDPQYHHNNTRSITPSHYPDLYMNYAAIATTVFTPLELGTVGLTEDDARMRYGADNVDCYISSFLPLEWSLPSLSVEDDHNDDDGDTIRSNDHDGMKPVKKPTCYMKVVVDITHSKNNNLISPSILGMHIAAPHAGEIIQGLSIAYRKGGLTYADLMNTVGIHPTIAEEFTTISITKSSGEMIEKASC